MIEYDALVNGIIGCFQDAVTRSDGTDADMLGKFDIPRFKRLAMLDLADKYPHHAKLLNKLHFRSNWKHEVHHEILKAHPRSIQRGVIYIDHGSVLGNWSDLNYISVLIQKPHDSYLFIKMDYCPTNLCIDRLYACKVTKVNGSAFQLYSVEGRISETLDLIYSFSM